MKLRLVSLIMLAVLTFGARADFNDGVVALMMGEYEKALSILLPLAETADHAYAQYFMGRMYAAGQGVPQDFDTAAEWYRKAAEKGVGDAQYRLAGMYRAGNGVPKDMEYAYGWYSVAAHVGNAKAAPAAAESAKMMSPAEMKAAEELSAELIEKYGNVPKETSRTQ